MLIKNIPILTISVTLRMSCPSNPGIRRQSKALNRYKVIVNVKQMTETFTSDRVVGKTFFDSSQSSSETPIDFRETQNTQNFLIIFTVQLIAERKRRQ